MPRIRNREEPSTDMNADEWVRRFAAELGAEPPSEEQVDQILKLAAIAAHASERTAAPVATWLAGQTGRSPDELREIAKRVNPGAEE
jgi:transcription initiation factor TFIIIB Brf1 subunit/transcription initiation factor TFIIB